MRRWYSPCGVEIIRKLQAHVVVNVAQTIAVSRLNSAQCYYRSSVEWHILIRQLLAVAKVIVGRLVGVADVECL